MKLKEKYVNFKERTQELFFNKISLYWGSMCGALVGILAIVLAPKAKDYADTIVTIGQTVISISVSSILVEWFGYVNYTRKRMAEILVEDEILKVLDMKRKKELKSALIKNIYMPNTPLDENNIATIIDDEMDEILKSYYYEEYILYVDASKDDICGVDCIKKNIRMTFTAKSINGSKCTIERLISTYLEPPVTQSKTKNGNESDLVKSGEGADFKEEGDFHPVQVTKLLVNGKNCLNLLGNEVPSKENKEEHKDIYSKIYYINRNNKKLKKKLVFYNSIDVDMEYTTIVKADDILYSKQIDKACKHFCIHFNAKPDEYDVIMEGFGFMSLGNSKRQRMIRTDGGCMLRFLDWILPGDGVNVVLKEKNHNAN